MIIQYIVVNFQGDFWRKTTSVSFKIQKQRWIDKYFMKQVGQVKNERWWIYKCNSEAIHLGARVRNYNFGESRGRSQVVDECSIVEKGSAWHNTAGRKTAEGTYGGTDRGAREESEDDSRRREKSLPPLMGVKCSAKERPRSVPCPFVCRGVSLEGPFVSSRTEVGGKSLYGAHMANPAAFIRHEITQDARNYGPLNYLVRVSLFIEYRACLFLRRVCVLPR